MGKAVKREGEPAAVIANAGTEISARIQNAAGQPDSGYSDEATAAKSAWAGRGRSGETTDETTARAREVMSGETADGEPARPRRITLPLTKELARSLHAGDQVLLTGTIYTSRDAGHKRMVEALARGEELPFDPKDATIYYVGPTPAKPGQVIGSAGPTTSGRMDAYAPTMMSAGARGMIGKGARLPEVVAAMKEFSGVYFGAIGGAGALLAGCIKSSKLIAYEDLGAEALRELYVEDMPLVVVIDCYGNNLYEMGREEYLKAHSFAGYH